MRPYIGLQILTLAIQLEANDIANGESVRSMSGYIRDVIELSYEAEQQLKEKVEEIKNASNKS